MARHFIKAPAVGKGELSTEQSSTPSTAKTAGNGQPTAEQGGPWKENDPEELGFPGSAMLGRRLGVGLGFGRAHWPLPSACRLTNLLCPCSRLWEAPAGVHGLHRAGRRARLWPGRPHLDGGLQVVSPRFSATSTPTGPAGDADFLFF